MSIKHIANLFTFYFLRSPNSVANLPKSNFTRNLNSFLIQNDEPTNALLEGYLGSIKQNIMNRRESAQAEAAHQAITILTMQGCIVAAARLLSQ